MSKARMFAQFTMLDLGKPSWLRTARRGYDLWIAGAAHSFCTDDFVLLTWPGFVCPTPSVLAVFTRHYKTR
jgi:hypothetical protein